MEKYKFIAESFYHDNMEKAAKMVYREDKAHAKLNNQKYEKGDWEIEYRDNPFLEDFEDFILCLMKLSYEHGLKQNTKNKK
jgi:hypothetical protein